MHITCHIYIYTHYIIIYVYRMIYIYIYSIYIYIYYIIRNIFYMKCTCSSVLITWYVECAVMWRLWYMPFRRQSLMNQLRPGKRTRCAPWCAETGLLIAVWIPSGYLTVCHGKSPFLIGKPSINDPGKRLHNSGKSPYSWVNQLFLWPFSIANC